MSASVDMIFYGHKWRAKNIFFCLTKKRHNGANSVITFGQSNGIIEFGIICVSPLNKYYWVNGKWSRPLVGFNMINKN